MAGGVSSSIQDSRRRVLVRRRKRILLRNEAQLNFVFASFPFRLCARGEACQGSPLNALRAPLTVLAARCGRTVVIFRYDHADVVIEGDVTSTDHSFRFAD